MKYNNFNISFPSKIKEFENIKNNISMLLYINELKNFDYLKKTNQEYYNEYLNCYILKKIKILQKKYSACYLNYYDMKEYQLSILRYDEKYDRMLSNDEIVYGDTI